MRRYPKLVTKSEVGGTRYTLIMTSPPKKKLCISFYFLVSAAAAKLWLAFCGGIVSSIGLSPRRLIKV